VINTYQELVTSIADELSRDDLGYKIPEWIQLAELSLSRYVDLKDGEQKTTGNLVIAQDYIDMPAGFKELRHIEIQTDPLRILRLVSMDKRSDVLVNSNDPTPIAYSWVGKKMYLAPVPTDTTEYFLYYYGKPTPLSEENPTNDLLEMGADVLKYNALTFSAAFLGEDDRIGTWTTLYHSGREDLKKEYWRAQSGGGVLRIRPDVFPRDNSFGGSY
jgi:hypothetical protein